MTTTPYTNPMDGLTRESLMRCAANAMAKSELFEDDNETLKAGISQRQNEINELKADLEKARQQFKDALDIIHGSQATAESSYQRAKMIGEERDALKAECAKLREEYGHLVTRYYEKERDISMSNRIMEEYMKRLEEADAECAKLRGYLIAAGNATGATLSDDTSTDFLSLVADNARAHVNKIKAECAKLRAECARAQDMEKRWEQNAHHHATEHRRCGEEADKEQERAKRAEARLEALTDDAAVHAANWAWFNSKNYNPLKMIQEALAAARQKVME